MQYVPEPFFWTAVLTMLFLGTFLGFVLQIVATRFIRMRRVLMIHITRAPRTVNLKWVPIPRNNEGGIANLYESKEKGSTGADVPLVGDFNYSRMGGGFAFFIDNQTGLPIRMDPTGVVSLIDGYRLRLIRKCIRAKQIQRSNGQDLSWMGKLGIIALIIVCGLIIATTWMVGKIYTGSL